MVSMSTSFRQFLLQGIRRHGFRQPWVAFARWSEIYLRAYYNTDVFNSSRNGERYILEQLSLNLRNSVEDIVVFDVGANRGSYAEEVLAVLPSAHVFCFEPIVAIAQEGAQRFANQPRVRYLSVALSTKNERKRIFYSRIDDTATSVAPQFGARHFPTPDSHDSVEVEFTTGDHVLDQLGLDKIHLLKIDVEGHEVDVLLGFTKLLGSPGRPELIQFEYGPTFVPARRALRDVYDILEPSGYRLGRLYPECVRFKSYEWSDDHFRIGNYIAVQHDSQLRTMLER